MIVLFQQQQPFPRQGPQKRGKRTGAGTDLHDLIAFRGTEKVDDALYDALVAQEVLSEAFLGPCGSEKIDVAHGVL